MRIARHIRRSGWGLGLGLAVTACVAGLHAWGLFDRLELDTLDLRLRYANPIPPSDLILHVDIDDDALERIHRWPWPRRLHAQLIDTLSELGARAVVMDILFAEPQRPRLPLPHADSPDQLAGPLARCSPDQVILDDAELARAVRRAGKVYLAMDFDLANRGESIEQVRAGLRERLDRHPDFSTRQLIDHVRRDDAAARLTGEALVVLCRRTHLGWHLARQFGANVAELVERTGIDRQDVDKILAGLKEDVARRLAGETMAGRPDLTADQLVEAILPTPPRDPLDVRDIRAAWETERAILASLQRSSPIPSERRWLYPTVTGLTPPLERLAAVAFETPFVTTYERVSLDGVLREIPLVACHRGRMLRQLGFAALCDVLEVPPDRVEMIEPGRLVLHRARWPGASEGRDVALPLDENGQFLLNWYAAGGEWATSFDHLAVGRVLEIPRNRSAVRAADRRARAEAVRFTTARGAAAAYEGYVALSRTRGQAERRLTTMPADDSNRPACERRMKQAAEKMARAEQNAVDMIHRSHEEIRTLEPQDDEERREFGEIRRLHHALKHVEDVQRRIGDRLAELSPLVEDKVCFVGYTATAVADFVSTPVFSRAPGVLAHANLFHTIYTGALVHRAPRWVAIVLILAFGLITSLITTWRGPVVSLLAAAVGLSAVYVLGAVALFYAWQVWIVVPSVVAAILSSWALITMYRQMTEGREKRLAFGRLGQYTSPTLARRIAEEPQALSRAEARQVTCYFSDLKGFTGISERLGAERTQALLNLYLERMSEVLDRHEAFINKFLGDGIFAFFNPAVNPQPDHVRLACEAALDSLAGLAALIAEQRAVGGDEAFAQLSCRIGLAAGTAVVGNCGSDRKFDYTCIGDTVNLAARLEPANKAFGTKIMVSESTRAATNSLYEWRYLGGLKVVGKAEVVGVYEMLGRHGTVSDEALEYASRYEQGVRLFQGGEWVDCITHFTRMLARRPDDAGLMLYIDRCRQFERFGTPDDWAGEIELTEK